MLIVIADTIIRKNEADIINALFDEGMPLFHLRKPAASANQIMGLLIDIKPQYINQIALHAHHQLASYFCLHRLHYTEAKRHRTSCAEWRALAECGYSLSTSLHQQNDINLLPGSFKYAFFGPVFNSISKPGYNPHQTSNAIAVTHTKLIAIGGINTGNMQDAIQMGFDGIAVLGAIWKSGDPVCNFKQIQKVWNHLA
ncbi:thiamine phosphate synthase [Flavihumibacter sp. ZG627]|uniref:thiamine phosphate synthase n=1 Tax=Flavihumibacter sp. ZG627 TaxID=1463156 RepID=UPI00057C7AE4|nr:thiamine phosphate synthase [Flavihumibacter sp. ZG627]KIC92082.1 hypothetical protein HY58_00495 [Flavihumibacter sp. ZG627]